MGKKREAKEAARNNEERFRAIRRGLIIATLASAACAAFLWAGVTLESFLMRDPQFTLAVPPDPGEESPAVELIGVKYTERSAIVATFQHDYGRSVYHIPLRKRRDELLRFAWVKDARVTRVWPNRLQIRISEREPVAFLALPGETQMPLVDREGHILLPETRQALNLPVLHGLTRQQTDEQRRIRVSRLEKLLADGEELAANVSEVDVSDPDNLKVMQDSGGKAVMLILGNRYFKRRLEKFRQNAASLLEKSPEKTVFDLRVEGSIYARPPQPTLTASEGGFPH